jgi:hypothetical protein
MSLSRPLDERCREAFGEFASKGVLSAANFDSAFRRAGYSDVRAEETERYHQNFVQQRQGVSGTHLREDEFLRVVRAHDDKRKFLESISISAKEWVCNAVRGVSHVLTTSTLYKGEVLWSSRSNETRMGIIMKGSAMLWGKQGDKGLVDFPVCEIGMNAVIGDGMMPRMATKVVALGTIDVLFMPMSEVKQRLGDRFIEEITAMLDVKDRHVKARINTMQRVCKRAMVEPPLSQLPFLPVKNHLEAQLAQGMQKLAQAQSQQRAAIQAAKRAKAQRMGGVSSDISENGPSSAFDASRLFRMERSGKLPSTNSAPVGGSTRSRTNMPHTAQVRSSIPRRIAASEFHVMIDTGTMMYDDLK